MDKLLQRCDEIINELAKFSTDVFYCGLAIKGDRLEQFEIEIGFLLPIDLKYILKTYNGFSLNGTDVNGLDKELKDLSIDKLYRDEYNGVGNPMPSGFLPFSADGFGNHYCLNLSYLKDGVCPVVFWQHDFIYEGTIDVEVCNNNFVDWVKEVMIDWALDEINYDGTEK